MELITSIILIVFAILQIILFFKIWGMTNDINAIKEKYLSEQPVKRETGMVESSAILSVGDYVVDKNGKEMLIKEIQNGKYSCYTNRGLFYEGDFDKSEISLQQ